MKVKRRKQAKNLLSAYRNFFGFREPYNVLIDGTFCKLSVQHKVEIKEQMTKYLQSEIQCYTTRCVLKELELLGDVMYPAKIVAQRLKLYQCTHKKKPVAAQSCLKSLLKDDNPEKFLLATQDFELTKLAASIPGVPLLYLHKNNIILDKLSGPTAKRVDDISQGKAEPSATQQGQISVLKKEANVESNTSQTKRKRKRPKGPNPLSCKKSKKAKILPNDVASGVTGGRKRKRRRHSAPAKES